MSYYKWVQFVLNSFVWEPGVINTFHGYLRDRSRSGPGQDVEVIISNDGITVRLFYVGTLSYEEWKPQCNNPHHSIWPYRYNDKNTYEFLLEKCRQKLEVHDCQTFYVSGDELNLLPWALQLLKRAN